MDTDEIASGAPGGTGDSTTMTRPIVPRRHLPLRRAEIETETGNIIIAAGTAMVGNGNRSNSSSSSRHGRQGISTPASGCALDGIIPGIVARDLQTGLMESRRAA